MTRPDLAPTPALAPTEPALHAVSLLRAAEAVLAMQRPRAPLKLVEVSLREGITFGTTPDPQALALNRGLLEDVVLVALAKEAAAEICGLTLPPSVPDREADALLARGLTDPEEQQVAAAYRQVLKARARAALRHAWAEVEVVAAGLREHHELNAQEVAHRIACAQSIRSSLLN
ncbi:hypothetical protein [Deinococcus navajonensis]|uniref:Uncharacterized protein n=1 Tax=Deinococcus navajonensis TaxID=309884 RepID=A0ABV8XPE8_9DEIO